MARITVEDCEKVIKNRFELVILASQRAREIFAGDDVTVDDKKDEKKHFIALREIASNTLSTEKLRDKVVDRFRSQSEETDFGEDLDELLADDTYNPYPEIEMMALKENKDNNISIVEEDVSIDIEEDIR